MIQILRAQATEVARWIDFWDREYGLGLEALRPSLWAIHNSRIIVKQITPQFTRVELRTRQGEETKKAAEDTFALLAHYLTSSFGDIPPALWPPGEADRLARRSLSILRSRIPATQRDAILQAYGISAGAWQEAENRQTEEEREIFGEPERLLL